MVCAKCLVSIAHNDDSIPQYCDAFKTVLHMKRSEMDKDSLECLKLTGKRFSYTNFIKKT